MKLRVKSNRRKSLLVDFNKPECVVTFKKDMCSKWEFESESVEKTLKKYSGQVFTYSAEHAAIMYELLERHLKPMTKHKRRGYITSKKINYIRLGDSSGAEFLFTCAFNVALAGGIYTALTLDLKLIICYFICVFGLVTYILKSAVKPQFFSEILTNIEESFSAVHDE